MNRPQQLELMELLIMRNPWQLYQHEFHNRVPVWQAHQEQPWKGHTVSL